MAGRKILNEELGRLTVEEYQQAEKHPLVIVLDNVRSMQNVGAVFRTSDAFRIQEILLCGITATPPHRDIQRSALGATETVNWTYFSTTQEALRSLRKQEYKIYAVEQVEASIPLQNMHWSGTEKIALVFGHEVKGVQQEIVHACDGAIEIPQFGSKHSVNISVSTGIVLWQFMTQLLQE